MLPNADDSQPLSRRRFALGGGLLVGLAGGIHPAARAQDAKEKEKEPKGEAVTVAAAWEAIVAEKLGKTLNPEQLKRVQRGVVARRGNGDRLKKFPVTNGDDPAEAFRADVD